MELHYIEICDKYISLKNIREISHIYKNTTTYYFYIHYFNSKDSIYVHVELKNSKNIENDLNTLNHIRKDIMNIVNNIAG